MGLKDRISEELSSSICLPAVGQGALAVECRENDDYILNLIKEVDHERTKICCTAERTFMKVMEGGCQVPIGVHTELEENEDGAKTKLKMKAIILSVDGSKSLEDNIETDEYTIDSAINLGKALALQLKNRGATEILQEIYEDSRQ